MAYLKITILILYYILLLCLCHVSIKRVILTPEFCFISCFIPQLVYALFYVDRWSLNINVETMMVYIFGGTIFVLSALIFRSVLLANYSLKNANTNDKKIFLNKYFLVLFCAIQIISLVLVSRAVEQVTNRNNLLEAIEMFGFLSKGTGLDMPSIPGKLNMLCYTSSFLWAYYLIHSHVYKYTTYRVLLCVNLVLSIIHHCMTGSRGGVVELLVASVVVWYLLKGEASQWKKIVSLRIVCTFVLLSILSLVFFRISLELLGRTAAAGEKINDYIARYLSAELKNIDIMISRKNMGFRSFSEWDTISSILSFMARRLGFSYIQHYGDSSTYLSINGFGLGNVYTIYYPMVHDMHYVGLFVFIPIMSFVSEYSFAKAIKSSCVVTHHNRLNLSKVIYGYLFSKLFFSFFSNRFFNNIISTGMIWCIFFWWIVKAAAESNLIRRPVMKNQA